MSRISQPIRRPDDGALYSACIGAIYQEDPGNNTAGLDEQMTSYGPDKTWSVVK